MKTEPIKLESEDRFGQRYSHPAFAVIGLSRVSGHKHLVGLDFPVHNYIEITISKATLNRNLSNTNFYPDEQLLTIAMSEAQLATFLTSSNRGSGTPCTLVDINRVPVPQLPRPAPIANQFKAEMEETMREIQKQLKKIADSLAGDKPPTKEQSHAASSTLNMLAHRLVGSTTFVAEQFEEHAERVVEQMKAEVNGHIKSVGTAPQLMIGEA